MKREITMEIELVYSQWDVLMSLIILGFTIGVVVLVMTSAVRLGWMLAPYIFIGAFIIWFIGGM
jgi:hypothetical protein